MKNAKGLAGYGFYTHTGFDLFFDLPPRDLRGGGFIHTHDLR